jgi:hypothetical protein
MNFIVFVSLIQNDSLILGQDFEKNLNLLVYPTYYQLFSHQKVGELIIDKSIKP